MWDLASQKIKNSFMSENNERNRHAETVIRNHVVWSMGAGFIPVLVADIFAVSAIQMDMIRQLCKVYDIDFSETRGKAIVTSLTSSTLARIGAGSIVKLIPGVGTYLGGVTVSVFAGASTYALGEVFKQHFSSGGTILDFDPARLKKFYEEKFEKGKNVVKRWKEDADGAVDPEAEPKTASGEEIVPEQAEQPKQDVVERLKELAGLKKEGIITEEEFEQMKKKLIGEM